jgi:hypothetical protein
MLGVQCRYATRASSCNGLTVGGVNDVSGGEYAIEVSQRAPAFYSYGALVSQIKLTVNHVSSWV